MFNVILHILFIMIVFYYVYINNTDYDRHFYQTVNDIAFTKIHVIGGGAQLDQVSEYISEVFSMESLIHNPFSKVAYPAFMEDVLQELGSSFAVATGAALRPYLE